MSGVQMAKRYSEAYKENLVPQYKSGTSGQNICVQHGMPEASYALIKSRIDLSISGIYRFANAPLIGEPWAMPQSFHSLCSFERDMRFSSGLGAIKRVSFGLTPVSLLEHHPSYGFSIDQLIQSSYHE